MNQDQLTSLLRTLLKIGGTYAASKGLGDNSGWEEIGGAVVLIAGVVWSWRHHSDAPAN